MGKSKDERQNRIIGLLSENGALSPKELCESIGVSMMTIRRDLNEMAANKVIRKYYGCVSLTNGPQYKIPMKRSINLYHSAQEMHYEEKMRIAQYAFRMIDPQDVIGIDNGTTCTHIIDFFNSDTNCLVYTYSQRILKEINKLHNDNIMLFLFGGYYHSKLQMFEHSSILSIIHTIHINKMFVGAVGVSLSGELSCVQPYEVEVRKAIIKQSDEVYLLTDSSKIGKSWYDKYGTIDDITAMITDAGITIEQKTALENKGLKIIVV